MEQRYMDIAHQMNLLALGQSAGVVYWKPAGLKLYENLKNFIRKHHEKRGYLEVKSPSLVSSQVFEQSGHSEKYAHNMFFIEDKQMDSQQNYALRPMSCPNHILLYSSEGRSYRQMPVRFFEFGEVFRNEPSGSLQVLFRQRQFCQDDSHVFVNEDNLISSISDYLMMSQEVYKELGFEKIDYAISLRPEKRFGDDSQWDKAENSLRQACISHNIQFNELPGEGAFYGPKIELKVQDKLGRSWQLGTLQLDYVLPGRFGLDYIDKNNKKAFPILLHHAVLGSLERMIGILLESFGKDIPKFLHPYESVIVAVSEKSNEYANIVHQALANSLLDNSDEPLGKKLAHWRERGIPDIYVIGEKEFDSYKQSGIKKAMLNQGQSKKLVVL